MNLEQLRKQAKELVRAARDGDAGALARLGGEPVLARAQLALAREHGYPSWPALVAAVEANADGFVRAATSGRRARAEAMLAARPEIARDPYVRLVRGEGWEGDVHAPGGPNGWAPLLYVCFSEFASVELARELLARGADANVTFRNEYGEMPALYGAAGVIHHRELTRLLLEAGANADDGESPYHATEARDAGILRLVLEHGGNPEPIVLAHALDDERLEHVRLLLEAGASPKELLPHAVRRGRGPEYVRLLAAHGAELEHRGGETWRGDVPLRTAYQHAVLRGQDENARVLRELGAGTTVDPADLAVAAIARGERPAEVPAQVDVDQQEVLILAALQKGRMALVVELFGPDLRGVVGGSPEGTLLEHVCWVGDPELARFLLAAGASVPTLDWVARGSQWHELPGRDYLAVAQQLVAAGAVIAPEHLEQADGPLAEWLEAQLRP